MAFARVAATHLRRQHRRSTRLLVPMANQNHYVFQSFRYQSSKDGGDSDPPPSGGGFFAELKRQLKQGIEENKELQDALNEVKQASQKSQEQASAEAQKTKEKLEQMGKSASESVTSKAETTVEDFSARFGDEAQQATNRLKEEAEKLRGAFSDASEKFGQEYTKTTEEFKQSAQEAAEQVPIAKETVGVFSRAAQSFRGFTDKVLPEDGFGAVVRETLAEARDDVFGSSRKARVSLRSRKKKEGAAAAAEAKAKAEEDAEGVEDSGAPQTNAVMVVAQPTGAWERFSERMRKTPIIQDILGGVNVAGKAVGDSPVGQGVKGASDKVRDVAGDLRDTWETSQNPLVYQLSGVWEEMFAETELGKALSQLRRLDPEFTMEEFMDEMNEVVCPEVIDAYLSGDERLLKQWCSSAAYAVVFAAMGERKSLGITQDNTILDIKGLEIVAARSFEKQPPIFVLRFSAQQVNCVKDAEGNIVEGAEDEIELVYYMFAMQRDYDETSLELQWKVVELAVLGKFGTW